MTEIKYEELKKTLAAFERVVKDLVEAGDNIVWDRNDIEQETFVRAYLNAIHPKIEEACWDSAYLRKNVIAEGPLLKQSNGRYEVKGHELSSGHPIEVLVEPEDEWENPYYVQTRIEHTNGDYYIYLFGSEQKIEGMEVRIRGDKY
jgi:hypothetical protein